MAFQTPITIKEALDNIQGKKYAMPAIQREFVWHHEQIERLFDSLMQGYPIGAFLFWEVGNETVRKYRWFDFVSRYHQKDRRHNQEFEPLSDDSGLIAILDGQQRLTALNIGLRGSYAYKLPRLYWNNPAAFPERWLYYNIAQELEDDENGIRHEFRFLTHHESENTGGIAKWFKVSNIVAMRDPVAPTRYLLSHGLMDSSSDHTDGNLISARLDRLTQLRHIVHQDQPISYFLEKEQDLTKVLNIFVRTNSGGTVLSHSDMLMSIATAQFKTMNARQEVNDRLDEFNELGGGFNFPRDFILKAALVLGDVRSVVFRIDNFTTDNLGAIEESWDGIMAALRLTVELAAQFGLSGGRLAAQNSLLPIAYHLYKIKAHPDFLTAPALEQERSGIRNWLLRTLIKRVWGGHSDYLLTGLRSVIAGHQGQRFPIEESSAWLARIGNGLRFSNEELDDIVETEYGPRAFSLLTLLYPFVDVVSNEFHVDHVFPRSKLTRRALDRTELSYQQGSEIRQRVNNLPNLQLLTGPRNLAKSNMMPRDWLYKNFANDQARTQHASDHDLGELTVFPGDVSGFVAWYEVRKELLLLRLREVLGVFS